MFLAVELICTGGTQMRKTILLAVAAAALIATGFGTNARAPETSQGIDPFQIQMTSGKGLPREELVDYTFVFPH